MNQEIHEAAQILKDTIEKYTGGHALVMWSYAKGENGNGGTAVSEDMTFEELQAIMFEMNYRVYQLTIEDEDDVWCGNSPIN